MKNSAAFPVSDDLQSGIALRPPAGARRILEALGRTPRHWLALTGILLAGNAANALSWRFAVPINTGGFSIALALGLYAMPGWGEWRRFRAAALAWRPNWRHTMLAIGAGLALAAPSVLFFALASARGGIGYAPIPQLPVPSLLVRELVEIPLLTALVEELVFRQYAFRALTHNSVTAMILANAGIFTLWHLVVTARTILSTHFVGSPLLALGAYVGSLGTIFVAGVIFALVRWRTGSFAYSALTHWVVLGLTTLAVWAL